MKIYTIEQAADICELSPAWIYRLINRGDLEAKKYGNTWLITSRQLNKYLKNREKKGTDYKHECRQWLNENGFTYNREKGIKRGYWRNDKYYGLTAIEAYEKVNS